MMDIVRALDDGNLFGPWFSGPSWATWKAVLKGAFALPMGSEELALFRTVAERDPPRRQVRELWAIVGRRGGKDSIASAVACYFSAFIDWRSLGVLRPGELASVLCLATDKLQAQIIKRYTQSYFAKVPLLRPLVEREAVDGLDLSTGAELLILASNFRSVRGRSIACVVLDECAFWQSEQTANPDAEVYQALVPSLATLPGAMLIGISTPYRRAGLLWEKHRNHYGINDDDVLVVRGPSRLFNPTLPVGVIDDALERDAAAASSEWLAEFRSDIDGFAGREQIECCVSLNVRERPPQAGVRYHAFVDPSGGSSDSFTLAVSHHERQGDVVVIDALREIKPPFSPSSVCEEFARLLRSYSITRVVGDRYGGEFPREQFRRHGIAYEPSEYSKSELYVDLLPLINSRRIDLLDHSRLLNQLSGLERRTSRTGMDTIDHAPGGHDDIANACAGAAFLAAQKRSPMKISQSVKNWSAIPQKVGGVWHPLGSMKRTLVTSGEARPAPLPAAFPSTPSDPVLPRSPSFSASDRLGEMASTTRTPYSEIARTINRGNGDA
jgi:hypothetical protein